MDKLLIFFKNTTRIVPLIDGYSLIPLNEDAFKLLNTDEDEIILIKDYSNLTVKLYSILMQFSQIDKIGYIEAEYFGGSGSQSVILFDDGKSILESIHKQNSINILLKKIGVKKKLFKDRFDYLGLNKFRKTEDWTK
ncbi:hypothetical protein [Leptospira kanakyensis]|uniref:hypothetical protein n=1 Tax=Leptospira kanakyensis TaxID=2484968 RepID=UPI00223DB371|nr:hypothetical protein [Leptospira kanakyensis]MCW7483289.1 hypothetical protein [Leptospira kanakyensis]